MENELKDILNKFNAWDYLQDNITKYNEIVWEWSKRDLSDDDFDEALKNLKKNIILIHNAQNCS
tara:strand:- start:459 stop:650 length:192 start_codon:yes stop_codon:yes gene_type:complete